MFSVSPRVFLVCFSRSRFLKRLAQSRTLDNLSPNFTTCSVHKCGKEINSSMFTPNEVEPCNDTENIGEQLTGKLSKKDILKIINAFFRSPEIKALAAENGLDQVICKKGFISFRKYCLESGTLPPDLHVILSDLVTTNGNPIDIFPYFLRHVKEVFPHLECMEDLKKIGDISQPSNWYPEVRALKRKFYFHCGPTNSGKTYHALKCFYESSSAIYCAPLKLLAVEVQQKSVEKEIPCDLFTGEEIRYFNADKEPSAHLSCTIEMCAFDKSYDVAVIDEVQMLRDPQRGWAWTRALLGLNAKEIHLCGEEAALEVVDSILCTTHEEFEVKRYERLTKLLIDRPLMTLANVRPGDCVVCFNKADIFSVSSTLVKMGYQVAIVYGSLPPHTKLAQCQKFNNPKDPCNVLVATDAVGMGLNLNIRRIVFYTLTKILINEQGESEKATISVSQALQIAGRAGRYGTRHSEGFVTTLKVKDLTVLEDLMKQKPEPVKRAGLLPTIDQLELFSYYLPHTTLSELIDVLIRLSTVDSSLYFMCEVKDLKALAQMLDHINLPLRVKYVFCCAPVNRKMHFVCVMFVMFAKMYSLNQTITHRWVCQKIGWPRTTPHNLRELVKLEMCHEVLDLYLWLSNRFEEYFPDAVVIRKVQKQMDRLIQEGIPRLSKASWEGEFNEAEEQKKGKRTRKLTTSSSSTSLSHSPPPCSDE